MRLLQLHQQRGCRACTIISHFFANPEQGPCAFTYHWLRDNLLFLGTGVFRLGIGRVQKYICRRAFECCCESMCSNPSAWCLSWFLFASLPARLEVWTRYRKKTVIRGPCFCALVPVYTTFYG